MKIENLVKNYGEIQALRGISLELRPGEIFGLLGPNGAGKTSIISTIVTLEKPTAGNIFVFGHNVEKAPRLAKVNIGLVPQELIHHGFFNVEEVLYFYSGYFGVINNKERIKYLMERLSLWEHRHKKVRQLSGGMKRRLLVAKALVHQPKLLLLDEPTAGVDIELRSNLWEFIRELKNDGVTILLTTHYIEEAEELCDRVGIIDKGLVKRVGPTRELIQDLTQRRVCFFLKDDKELEHPLLVEQDSHKKVFCIPSSMTMAELLQDLNLNLDMMSDLKISEGTLEEAMVSILRSEA